MSGNCFSIVLSWLTTIYRFKLASDLLAVNAYKSGGIVFMEESWKKGNKFCKNQKREVCSKPENDIFKSPQLQISAKIGMLWKTGNHPKDNEKWLKPGKREKSYVSHHVLRWQNDWDISDISIY